MSIPTFAETAAEFARRAKWRDGRHVPPTVISNINITAAEILHVHHAMRFHDRLVAALRTLQSAPVAWSGAAEKALAEAQELLAEIARGQS